MCEILYENRGKVNAREDKVMVRQLKAVGGAVVGFGINIFRIFQILWYLGVVAFAGLLVHDLFRIPVSVNSPKKYALEETLWVKMTPEEEARLLEFQKHCRHVYRFHNHWTYYCPLCRKKLVEGTVPLTGY